MACGLRALAGASRDTWNRDDFAKIILHVSCLCFESRAKTSSVSEPISSKITLPPAEMVAKSFDFWMASVGVRATGTGEAMDPALAKVRLVDFSGKFGHAAAAIARQTTCTPVAGPGMIRDLPKLGSSTFRKISGTLRRGSNARQTTCAPVAGRGLRDLPKLGSSIFRKIPGTLRRKTPGKRLVCRAHVVPLPPLAVAPTSCLQRVSKSPLFLGKVHFFLDLVASYFFT